MLGVFVDAGYEGLLTKSDSFVSKGNAANMRSVYTGKIA